MPVTIKQIAEASGFSVPTVSQVLNNKGHLYRPQTREKVLQVAQELGYRPNSFRWALRTGRFNNLGLLIPADALAMGGDAVGWPHLADALARRDMHLTVATVGEINPENPNTTPKMLREWSVDGLLIACGEQFPEDLRQLIEDHRIPAVDVGVRRQRDCVYGDVAAGVADVMRELAEGGHRQVALFDSSGGRDTGSADRRKAFADAAKTSRLSVHAVQPESPLSPADRLQAAATLLDGEDRPTAVIAGSADDAATLLLAACRRHLDVPRDLSLIAMASRPVDAMGVVVDRLGVDEAPLLGEAADMLLRRIDQPGKSLPAKKIALTRHHGETVKPV